MQLVWQYGEAAREVRENLSGFFCAENQRADRAVGAIQLESKPGDSLRGAGSFTPFNGATHSCVAGGREFGVNVGLIGRWFP